MFFDEIYLSSSLIAVLLLFFFKNFFFVASIPAKLTLQEYEHEVQKLKSSNPNWKIPPAQKNAPKKLRSFVAEDIQLIRKKFDSKVKESK